MDELQNIWNEGAQEALEEQNELQGQALDEIQDEEEKEDK